MRGISLRSLGRDSFSGSTQLHGVSRWSVHYIAQLVYLLAILVIKIRTFRVRYLIQRINIFINSCTGYDFAIEVPFVKLIFS